MNALLFGLLLQSQPVLAPAAVQSRAAVAAPTDVAAWERKDFEARWLAYQAAIKANARAQVPWLAWLRERREFDLLALIALCDGNMGAASALADAGAPQWPRVAVWMLRQTDSHTMGAGRKVLLEKDPPRILGWLEAHRDRLPAAARALEAELAKKGVVPAHRAGDFPPYDPAQVFAVLDTAPNQDLPELGSQDRSEPGVRYLHQVLRTIQAFGHSSVREEPHLGRLVRLTRHKDPRVRRAAFAAFSHVPGSQIPYRDFLAIARSPAEDEDRRAALMAASFAGTPEVWVALHHVARDPLDPTWKVAISRIGDLGNGFTLSWLEPLERDRGRDELVAAALQSIRAREAARKAAEFAGEAEAVLRRAAWAEKVKDPASGALTQWSSKLLQQWMAQPDVAARVQALAADPELKELIGRVR